MSEKQEQIIIEFLDENRNILKEVVSTKKVVNPYDFSLEHFLPNTEALTLESFFKITQKLIEDSQKKANIRSDSIIELVEEYPPESMASYGQEVITFKVAERKPGMMDKKGTSRPHRKHTYAYEYSDPSLPNKVVTVESRPVDHVIEFTCWATTNKLANRRAIWLEKLLINCAFVYELNGAERFFWKERRSDSYMTVGNQRLFYRPIQFFLRFREFDAKVNSTLRNVLIQNGIIRQ